MAVTVKRPGAGTQFELEDPATPPGTWVLIGCVYEITPPGISYDQVEEELCLSDTTSDTATTAAGDPAADEITLSVAFDSNSDEDKKLEEVAKARVPRNWRITYPAGNTETFMGYISTYKPDTVQRREYMRASVTIVRTGAVTKAAAPA